MRNTFTIKKKWEFSEVFESGRCYHDDLLVIYVRKSQEETTKFGICVGKKIGNSVERNRIRRRLREVIRSNLSNMKKNHRVLVVARSACKSAGYWEIFDRYCEMCKKAEIMK